MKIYNIGGYNICANPMLLKPVEKKVALTAKERIFSLRPWIKYRTVIEMVADDNVYQGEDGVMIAHPHTVIRILDDMGMFGTMH